MRAVANDGAAWDAEVVVSVALHNHAHALMDCLASILAQRGTPSTAILIHDDESTDGWTRVAGPVLHHPSIVLARSRCGSAARARNRLLDLADELFPAARWVARLDADDRFAAADSLAQACRVGERSGALYVLGGNRLRWRGALLPRSNPAAGCLLDSLWVVDLLGRMADGSAENELPSCNLLLAARCGLRYPDVASAEDHWLVADLLINRPGDGAILTAPFYCDYTLGGSASRANRRFDDYLRSRRALYRAARRWVATAAEAGCA